MAMSRAACVSGQTIRNPACCIIPDYILSRIAENGFVQGNSCMTFALLTHAARLPKARRSRTLQSTSSEKMK